MLIFAQDIVGYSGRNSWGLGFFDALIYSSRERYAVSQMGTALVLGKNGGFPKLQIATSIAY